MYSVINSGDMKELTRVHGSIPREGDILIISGWEYNVIKIKRIIEYTEINKLTVCPHTQTKIEVVVELI